MTLQTWNSRSRSVRNRPRAGRHQAPDGFTIIELLVVMAIIGIVLALVMGVSRYISVKAGKDKTVLIQRIVCKAIDTYRDENNNALPPEDSADDHATDDMMRDLSECQASAKVLSHLPADCWTGGHNPILDGFNREMRYMQSEGLGGTYVLISPGPDGEFNGDPDNEEDNIRSDRQ
ncbi:MAG: type II secretion system protein [Phycisphaerae bacterium]|nr:type II secretion system protein [Phycisphaerae bacterium]